MSLFNFDIATFMQFAIIFMRMSAIIFIMPIIGSSTVPAMAKITLVGALSMITLQSINMPPLDLTMSIWQFAVLASSEVLIGLTIGFSTQLVFSSVQLAGHIIGFQMGFAIVNVLDPATNSQVSITAQFQNIMALLIFLTIGGHHMLISASVASFHFIPALGFEPNAGIVEMMINLTKNVFIVGIKLAAPIMATLFFLNVGLGLIARTVPQMNVFIVGFPLQIGIGLFMLGATAPIFFAVFRDSFGDLIQNLPAMMKLM